MLNLVLFLLLALFPLAAAAGPAVQAPAAGGGTACMGEVVETARILGPPVAMTPLPPAEAGAEGAAGPAPAQRPAALTQAAGAALPPPG